jgi:hypothetical protein
MDRTGSALLPLHAGKVPPWLSERMARLGRVLVEAIVLHYGRDEVLRRLAHPFWFQSLGAVMGMDWHSSGITTTVLGALKRGLAPVEHELGLYVCGGKGAQSRRTPVELEDVGARTGLDAGPLVRASRLSAKVDSAAVQDGFALYMHGFVVSVDGAWTVVQQGMNTRTRQARRYHWLSEGLSSFVDAPHAAINGPGGKDRHPHPVRLDVYDATIRVLRSAVDAARLGRDEKLSAIHELDRQARRLEAVATGPSFEQLVAEGWSAAGEELPPVEAPPRHRARVTSSRKARGPRGSAASAQLVLPGLEEV